MPTDFHFVPLAPEPISGESVLKQVEQAMNELGTEIDDNTATADNALEVANSALFTANSAIEIAGDSKTTAQNALDYVDALTTRVSNVEVVVHNALAQANSAYDIGVVADSKADNAQTSADKAQALANSAQTAADNAQSAADNAQITATSAMDAAGIARGVYLTDDAENFDANTIYGEASLIYVVGSSPLNFPADLAEPFWFDVFVTDNGEKVIQKCRNDTSDLIYTRIGSVDANDPEKSVVTWGAWALPDGGAVPSGAIIMWSGAVDAVPGGWALCDGTNGTPDLRDRFIVGAGNTYASGATGGALSATTSTVANHAHSQGNVGNTSLTIAQMPLHQHSDNIFYTGAQQRAAWQIVDGSGPFNGDIYTSNVGGSGAHTHSNPNTNAAGGHAHTVSLNPPYYALAYIMKI